MIDLEALKKRVSPDSKEEQSLLAIAEALLRNIRDIVKEEGLDAEPVLVGSVSKGTYLDPDIDVFISFNRRYDRESMVAAALGIGHRVLPDAIERYAEHPYVSGHIDGVKIDVVPCYRIEKGEKIISAVDRSPLHTRYVLDNLAESRRGEVRLLKAFMKTAGIYGSEVMTRGFSGYVCELLIIKHGTFLDTIRSFSVSRGRYVISGDSADLKKFREPAVIIDPVDNRRNAAAAIGIESLASMRVLSREFLNDPSEDYFSRQRKKVPVKMDRGTSFRVFRLRPPAGMIEDTIYPQAERFRNILTEILDEGGFDPVGTELLVDDDIEILVECRLSVSPKFFIHMGPPADSARTHDFITKWKTRNDVIGPYIKGDRLYADVPARQLSIEDYVSERIAEFNIGAHLNELKDSLIIVDPLNSKDSFPVMDKYFSRSIL